MKLTEVSRRSFFKIASGYLAALISIAGAIPMVWSLVGSILKSGKKQYVDLTDTGTLPVGSPQKIIFTEVKQDAFLKTPVSYDVWVVKNSMNDIKVFSPICPHLGCRYTWNPQLNQFICPCHGSVFNMEGKAIAGPAPRGLDTLPVEKRGDKLYVAWERFKVGVSGKITISY